jgi:2-dehydro-3-deoxy-D-gluconate 5-dehydrogenase
MATTSPFDLSGRTALVTGCSQGIGAAIAVALADAGADVVGVSRSVSNGQERVAARVIEAGRTFTHHACDLGRRVEIERLLGELEADRRQIDILVNNAAIIRRAPAAQHSDAEWDEVLAVNLTAPFILSRGLGRHMLSRGYGKIIFVASVLSFQGGISVPSYAASKAALANMAKALANEWAGHGVNVNAVAPGYVATSNTAALREDKAREREILDRTPAARWGRPADIAGPVVFLASPGADWVHGATLAVDGGWLSH